MAETESFDSKHAAVNNDYILQAKPSHKQQKALLKKQRRKLKRQALAKERDSKLQQEEEIRKKSPGYWARLKQEEERAKAEILQIEEESLRQRELWEWSEEVFREKLKQKKEQEERERLNRLEIERKIKEEWEERQKKEKEEEERRKEKKLKQEELLRQAREGENKESDWHNPLAPVQYGQERTVEPCPFFCKVGACRFGDRCSRAHSYPELGQTILFTNMFRHFQLDQGLCEEYDTDIVLEYEDSEVYQKFSEFYDDTLPEFKAAGHVTQFKVCCNFQPHLRGNVYVSYERNDEAFKAYTQFNARWYGGKQLTAQFVDIPSWKRAICGLFGRGRCPKGKECNFLHVFKNPTNEFSLADKDIDKFTPQSRNERHGRRFQKHSYSSGRRDSRSPSRSYRKHRSRSSDRHRSKSKRSHSRERKYNGNYKRSRYSRSRSRETYRELSRSRSNSRDKEYESRRPARSRSKESSTYSYKTRSRSRERTKKSKHSYYRSKSRSKSRSPKRNNHKHKKRKHKEKYKYKDSSDDDNSDYEEVWVEKTNDSQRKNGT